MDDRFTSEVWFRSEVEKLLALIKKYRVEGTSHIIIINKFE